MQKSWRKAMRRIIVNKKIVPKGYGAITIGFFIFVREEWMLKNKWIINHEKIHLRQQAELLYLGFLIWYGIDFCIKYAKYRDWETAYRNIALEREAYANKYNLEYLKTRRFWVFWKYRKVA